MDFRKRRLPYAYDELEYITTSTTAYLDTGIIPTTTVDWELKTSLISQGGWSWIMGGSSWKGIHTQNTDDGRTYVCSINNSYSAASLYNDGIVSNGEVFTLALKGTTTYFNGNSVNTITRSAGTNSLYVGGYHNTDDSISMQIPQNVYNLKFWDSDTLVRDFVPARRIADSVVGMYDLVNDVFYTNAGTGTFTAGDVVGIDAISINGKEVQTLSREVSTLDNGKYQVVEYITNGGDGASNYVEIKGKAYDTGSTKTVIYDNTYSFPNVSTRQIVGYDGNKTNHYFGVQSAHPEIGQTSTGINTKVTLSTNTIYKFRTKYYSGSGVNTELWVYDKDGNLLTNGHHSNSAYLGAQESSFFVFRCAWTGAGAGSGTKFYGGKIWFDDELVGELVPCKRISDGVVGIYNITDNTFWVSTGTVTAGANSTYDLSFWDRSPYLVKNYLENTSGTYAEAGGGASTNVGSYINTGIHPTAKGVVKMKLQFAKYTGSSNPYQCLFGAYDSNTKNFGSVVQKDRTYFMDGSQAGVAGTWNFDGTTDYTIEYSAAGKYLIQNGTKTTFNVTALSTTSDLSIYLFTDNAVGGTMTGYDTTYTMKGKIYYFQYLEDDVVLHNLIPVVRATDKVAGMYDTVTDTFFTNAGIGTFNVG